MQTDTCANLLNGLPPPFHFLRRPSFSSATACRCYRTLRGLMGCLRHPAERVQCELQLILSLSPLSPVTSATRPSEVHAHLHSEFRFGRRAGEAGLRSPAAAVAATAASPVLSPLRAVGGRRSWTGPLHVLALSQNGTAASFTWGRGVEAREGGHGKLPATLTYQGVRSSLPSNVCDTIDLANIYIYIYVDT